MATTDPPAWSPRTIRLICLAGCDLSGDSKPASPLADDEYGTRMDSLACGPVVSGTVACRLGGWDCGRMVDTRSRGYLLAARWMLWCGIVLFVLGLAGVAGSHSDGAMSFECEPTCRRVESGLWNIVGTAGALSAVTGLVLLVAAFLMVMLRRPRSEGERAKR
ncbi:hypothetical protein AB0N93_16405 [Streptomyces sp. NPDC091267]|uniref:hypothetical protein n=1 Tax=Streptomyces sp. NPDC091267 TaxID=3155195 RepID=UPI00342F3A2C